MSTTDLLIRKDDLSSSRLRTAEDPRLADGQIRVRIDSFALTSNNITYAAFGDAMNYWQFYPTGEEGWGTIPVWGFAMVVHSLHPGVATGERLYGYFPMASSAVLTPERLSPERFTDGAAHRSEESFHRSALERVVPVVGVAVRLHGVSHAASLRSVASRRDRRR